MINLCGKAIDHVWFGTAYSQRKVFATTCAFNEKKCLQNLLRSIPYDVPFQHSEKSTFFAERVINLLRDIYDGREVSFGFSLAMDHLSAYTKKVIETVFLVPLGYVTSYGLVAKAAGGSPRAVGRVMALNPFPLIVPCHRVVRSDFKLGGYGAGLDLKLEILRRESRAYASEREIHVNNKKLLVFPVELVLKRLGKGKC
ncbi:methylated-DNA--[protein]-cysteine S-methyltransferase [Candidatus Bathyarchaeota archaeon]|nr:methylated-DNA--[protein]-cysteine S-methyltransferase [Candidatus Bathyarchaeota archaeon]